MGSFRLLHRRRYQLVKVAHSRRSRWSTGENAKNSSGRRKASWRLPRDCGMGDGPQVHGLKSTDSWMTTDFSHRPQLRCLRSLAWRHEADAHLCLWSQERQAQAAQVGGEEVAASTAVSMEICPELPSISWRRTPMCQHRPWHIGAGTTDLRHRPHPQ